MKWSHRLNQKRVHFNTERGPSDQDAARDAVLSEQSDRER